uniref:transketolase n=1 Tax=Plecturocebus moloch TaxID=9523 RepID=B1MTU8_PLEMO|nr:transketolase-like 1 (predicted) [Plecturocebus moloch]
MAFASYYCLDNLVAIFDVNRLGHSGALPVEHCIKIHQRRCKAFGWNTYVVDGQDVEALCQVFWQASQVKHKPTAVVAKTFRGWGTPSMEDAESWHGKPMPRERADAIIKLIESQIETSGNLDPQPPIEDSPEINIMNVKMISLPDYRVGDRIATQKACGLALAKLGNANDRVIVLDGDTKYSTFSEMFNKEYPERFIECFMAEQNMVSVALGCASRGRTIAFASTFAAFLTRAFDQIRMGALSESNINIIGSHCGVSVGEDGASQMALDDIAMFRTIPTCTIFYPSDAVSTEHAVSLAANAKILRYGVSDKVTVIGAGITVYEALAAADELAKQDIFIRVIDLFTIKPLDVTTIIYSAKATEGRIITVEDHYPQGGIGEVVYAAFSMDPGIKVHSLAVLGVPRSGKPKELLDMYGISARHIVVAVKCMLLN